MNKLSFMRMEAGSVRRRFSNGRMKDYKNAREYGRAVQEEGCAICGAHIEHHAEKQRGQRFAGRMSVSACI